jgi:uncharacterized RDD family membrane protein YckC
MSRAARDGGRSPFRAAGRLALFPARVAAKASRKQIGSAADEHLVPEVSRIADRAFATQLPEELARSIAEHRVLERLGVELAENGALDAAVDRALASEKTAAIVDRIVHSDAMRQAIHDVVTSTEVRDAVTQQTRGVFEDLATDLRTQAVRLDSRVETAVRRKGRAPGVTPFAGVVSRGLVFAIDLLAIAVVSAVLIGILALVSYLLGGLGSKALAGGLVGGEFLLVAGTYLVVFWSIAGRTPGMQLMGVRLRDRSGGVPSLGRALVRVVMTWFSIAVLFLGYVPILFDARRRAVPDLVAGTEVVYDENR